MVRGMPRERNSYSKDRQKKRVTLTERVRKLSGAITVARDSSYWRKRDTNVAICL